MKLLTKELEEKFKKYPLRSQDGKGSYAEVLVKYFNPVGAGTWLITEAEKQDNGDYELFGYCHITDWEWGYVMLSELENLQLPFGMKIERDLYTGDSKYIKDFVDYPYEEKIALKSGYYFIPVDKKDLPFFDKLKKTDKVVKYEGEELEVYNAFNIEVSKQVDDYFGDQMGNSIDDYLIHSEENLEM